MKANKREKNMLYYENITFQKFIKKEKTKMKKLNNKAVFGIGAGLVAAAVGACCLFKKKHDNEYDNDEVISDDYEYADADEEVESEED